MKKQNKTVIATSEPWINGVGVNNQTMTIMITSTTIIIIIINSNIDIRKEGGNKTLELSFFF